MLSEFAPNILNLKDFIDGSLGKHGHLSQGYHKVRLALSLPGVVLTALILLAAPVALANEQARVPLDDPFKTGMLAYHQIRLLGDPGQIAFDERVRVLAPEAAEDSAQVPVTVDASALGRVERLLVWVDYGPIPHILTYYPEAAEAKLSFRFKIDQATPIRAAALTPDGVWHIGHRYIDAAGGGCTAPALAYASDDWEEHLGKVQARIWPETGRVRAIVDHPMDTGLVDGIPVFILQDLALTDQSGQRRARLDLFEPVSEDPTFTFYLGKGDVRGPLRLQGGDNNGNQIDALIPIDRIL